MNDEGLVSGDGIWSDEGEWEALGLDEIGDEHGPAEAVPVLAVVGRPNVGKSTLVNRIIGRREAVVQDVPGVTRDRVSYDANWNGRRFTVQDTGGWEPDAKGLQKSVAAQAELAMKTADVVLLVVDTIVGATATDEAAARVLRRGKVPVLLAANKVDDERAEAEAAALWSLGLGQPHSVSATHGRGTGDLLDEILKALPHTPRETDPTGGPRRVALVGKPNVGKSSLLNRLTGAGALVEDALFATLDPAVRRMRTPAGRLVTIADTVGFVAHLPTHLVEAFRSTLEEVAVADVVLHVVDGTSPDPRRQLAVVRQVLADIRAEADKSRSGRHAVPVAPDQLQIVVVNKTDRADPMALAALRREELGAVLVSARTGRGIEALLDAVDGALPQLPRSVDVVVPWERGDLVEAIRRTGDVTDIDYTEQGSRVRARVGEKLAGALAPYAV